MSQTDINLHLDITGFRIRHWLLSDKPSLVKYANNRHIWLNLRDQFPHPYREEDAEHWLQQAMQGPGSFNLAIASERESIGAIGLEFLPDVHCKSAGLGY